MSKLINEEISHMRNIMGLNENYYFAPQQSNSGVNEFFSMPGEREGLPAANDEDIPTVTENDFDDYSPDEYFMDSIQQNLFEYWDYSRKHSPDIDANQFRSDIEESLNKLIDTYMNTRFDSSNTGDDKTKDLANQAVAAYNVNESVVIRKEDITNSLKR